MTVPTPSKLSVPRALLLICALGLGGTGLATPVHADPSGADQATAAELGVDIYPGAVQFLRAVRMQLTGQHFVTVKYVTADSEEQVLGFYKGKLGPTALTTYHMGNAIISRGNQSSKESVLVTIVPHSAVNNGKTQITILHNTKD